MVKWLYCFMVKCLAVKFIRLINSFEFRLQNRNSCIENDSNSTIKQYSHKNNSTIKPFNHTTIQLHKSQALHTLPQYFFVIGMKPIFKYGSIYAFEIDFVFYIAIVEVSQIR